MENITDILEPIKIKHAGRPIKYITDEEKKAQKKISNMREEERERRRLNSKKYHIEHYEPKLTHDNSIKCICGGFYTMNNLKNHLSTQKHIKRIKEYGTI